MILLAIDPGPKQSAFVVYDSGWPMLLETGIVDNDDFVNALSAGEVGKGVLISNFAIEMIASYGMPVGAEVFETCVWIGRFIQAWGAPHALVYRKDVKFHLCGQPRAKDSNIRQALLDRYGGKQTAIGNRARPGPLYGVKADIWSALAVAVTYADNAARKAA